MKSDFVMERSSEIIKTKNKEIKKTNFRVQHSLYIPEINALQIVFSVAEFVTNPVIMEFAVMIIAFIMNRSFYYFLNNRFFVFGGCNFGEYRLAS